MTALRDIVVQDELLLCLFDAIDDKPISVEEKLKTLVRAGQVAEIYRSGLLSHETFQKLFAKPRAVTTDGDPAPS